MLSESMDNLSSRKLNQQSSREPQGAGGDATRASSEKVVKTGWSPMTDRKLSSEQGMSDWLRYVRVRWPPGNWVLHDELKSVTRLIWLVSVTVIGLTGVEHAWAQNCESMSGPSRTDCFMGRARILRQQSDIAVGTARLRVDQEILRAATGTSVQTKLRTAKSKYKIRLK
jgi:hypothetical protein